MKMKFHKLSLDSEQVLPVQSQTSINSNFQLQRSYTNKDQLVGVSTISVDSRVYRQRGKIKAGRNKWAGEQSKLLTPEQKNESGEYFKLAERQRREKSGENSKKAKQTRRKGSL